MKHRYRVYDCEEGRWFPGNYDTVELRDVLGIADNFSKYARMGVRLRRRYMIEFDDEEIPCEPKNTLPSKLLEEWDRVRIEKLKWLRGEE